MNIQFGESVHPHDPDAYEMTWEHNGHNHFVVVPRELLTESKTWLARHADRINTACTVMFNQAGGDGRG